MLQITRGASNTLITTLRENQTEDYPYFLFLFKSEGKLNSEVAVVLTDSSTTDEKQRFNKFVFIEGTTATLTNGIWEYHVYGQSSSTNTDPSQSDSGRLEVGLARVRSTTDNINFTKPATSDTFTFANG